ncbi:hypothetical protein AURDEDRAFT_148395, partial [Auricularia subglabra TFB-10046 SS5]
MSALRPLQLVDGPTSPGPSSAPYSSLVSPPPSATFAKPDRRLSLQLQSPRTPGTPTFPSPAQLKRHSSQSQGGAADRRVLTLAERHADLLRFIAQKESKCLELRQQLAQHEADLLALKRKWERIVSRGTSGASTSSMPTPAPSNRDSMDLFGMGGGIKDGVGRMLSGLGEMFPASEASAGKQEPSRSSLSGSSASTLYSEPDREEEEPDSSATTPAEELLVDLASPVDDKTPSPPPPPPTPDPSGPSQSRPRPKELSLSSSPLSPSVLSPPPVPMHSAALASIVPMVNRKWEELKGTETLQKSQKRASMLLNDVFAALVPPPAPTPTERRRASGGSRPLTGSRPPTSGTPLPSRIPSNSSRGGTTHQPVAKARPQPGTSAKEPSAARDLMDDDDDWNW